MPLHQTSGRPRDVSMISPILHDSHDSQDRHGKPDSDCYGGHSGHDCQENHGSSDSHDRQSHRSELCSF